MLEKLIPPLRAHPTFRRSLEWGALGYALIMPIAMAIADGTRCAASGCARGSVLEAVLAGVRETFAPPYLTWSLTHAAMIAAVAGVFSFALDRAHKRENTLLRERVDKYHEALEKLDYGFYRTTVDGRFLLANAKFVAMLGYDSLDELMAAPVSALYAADSGRERFLAELRHKGHVHQKEFLLVRKDGRPVVVTDDAHLLGNIITGIISTVENTSGQFIIPVCAYCNMMRDGDAVDGVWVTPPAFFHNHMNDMQDPSLRVVFSHGMCPPCATRQLSELR